MMAREETDEPRITIVGIGYVGLSTAACLASKFHVTGNDLDLAKIGLIGQGRATFLEKGLQPLLEAHVRNGMLQCTTNYSATSDSDIVFITVGTPSSKSGEIDLSQVRSASRSIGEAIAGSNRPTTVVVKSTVIPGTTRSVVKPILEQSSGRTSGEGFGICSNPEFLQAGPGFAGSCFPKDVQALVDYAKRLGVDPSILESTLKVNETQPDNVVSQAEKMLNRVDGKKIAVLGLAFNPNADDIRESRAIAVIRKLVSKGAMVGAYDPMAMDGAKRELGPITRSSASCVACSTV